MIYFTRMVLCDLTNVMNSHDQVELAALNSPRAPCMSRREEHLVPTNVSVKS